MKKATYHTLVDLANKPRPRLEGSAEWTGIVTALREAGQEAAEKATGRVADAGRFAAKYADSLAGQPHNAQRVANDLISGLSWVEGA